MRNCGLLCHDWPLEAGNYLYQVYILKKNLCCASQSNYVCAIFIKISFLVGVFNWNVLPHTCFCCFVQGQGPETDLELSGTYTPSRVTFIMSRAGNGPLFLNKFFVLSLQGQLRINPKKYHEAFIPSPVSSTQSEYDTL